MSTLTEADPMTPPRRRRPVYLRDEVLALVDELEAASREAAYGASRAEEDDDHHRSALLAGKSIGLAEGARRLREVLARHE